MSDRQLRQTFLNDPEGRLLRAFRIGVVGLGGGGSQVAKFLAQAGCTTLTFFDPDKVEGVNANRTDGLTSVDVDASEYKVDVARRLLLSLDPQADVRISRAQWQDAIEEFNACTIIVGCVDTFAGRRDLERAARQQLSPYVDIGLDVHSLHDAVEPPRMSGQVILSMPGEFCMACMSFLTEAKLAREALHYGGNGGRQQVGWGNGVLAATAAGVVVELITGWSQSTGPIYLQYDGNRGTVSPHERLRHLPDDCVHFPPNEVGPPKIRAV